ncbi:diguanylate cyclase (GGDEF) domain-containing protein [Yoonia rosea]|uniref:Diguanylate cyclase (GGDEF) domain-containing protein n=1 Tax=Yoonia rosea TaxID=287098 RepID=A0A1R3WTX8_9RHOB|nr:diguanylate cyclase [Yoonia rosea]SIT80807.1 diguanylate cyclase (GGDEF) domain-containing protein [Yoonia rosea]
MQFAAQRASRSIDPAHRLARRIFLTSVTNGLAAILVIVGVSFWLTAHVNTQASTTSKALINSALEAGVQSVTISVQDYAFWDFAYLLVTERQSQELYENFGTGATSSPTFDFIYILDGDGTALYAYQSGGTGSDLSVIDSRLAAQLYARVTATEPHTFNTPSGFAFAGEYLSTVAAARILPDGVAEGDTRDFPILIAGNWLSETYLQNMAERLLLPAISIHEADTEVPFDQSAFLLRDIEGQPVAQLMWTALRPGQNLLQTALPVLLALCALTLIATLTVGRASSIQASELLEQKQLARTDKLTGLINRAGLEELITSKPLVDAIARGHLAVVYLDLNNFKVLNDAEGHDAGDLALQIFAERVVGAIRADDIIVRMGGDEFICILIDKNPGKTAENIVRRIMAATAPPVRIGDATHALHPSIGVAVGAPDLAWRDLQKNADRAMYRAKSAKTREPVFHPGLTSQLRPV